MKQIIVRGWNTEFAKISLTKLLRTEFGYPLSKAKAITDAVLSNQEIRIPCGDQPCERIIAILRELGVNAQEESGT